jgi:hypothetical protein
MKVPPAPKMSDINLQSIKQDQNLPSLLLYNGTDSFLFLRLRTRLRDRLVYSFEPVT